MDRLRLEPRRDGLLLVVDVVREQEHLDRLAQLRLVPLGGAPDRAVAVVVRALARLPLHERLAVELVREHVEPGQRQGQG